MTQTIKNSIEEVRLKKGLYADVIEERVKRRGLFTIRQETPTSDR